ncbi:hypothetical protein Ami103574_11010 [Aminipila butyrica]|uniref:Uncharacterized protein n=1 Tax=Aminipila butyrica TaxID=433296 RepID=A0A858BW49_9FIRM|nr:hypothetical protein [Aminipila butyrica]QIB69817.1 hypothetical protein Ami103574_11010 [Aminipila butyrica]
MLNADSPVNKDAFTKNAFANLSASSHSEITALEQKLQESSGEKVVLIAYHM